MKISKFVSDIFKSGKIKAIRKGGACWAIWILSVLLLKVYIIPALDLILQYALNKIIL
ncbi:hypothetical protein OBV_02010 [Oscillibacter valericigenes Sjm18-20]|nr:hypothetical protein OBV_02010 [Oscillibacter valericigenes Sjm18-20]